MQAAAGTSSGGAQQEQLEQQVSSLNKRITTLKHENQQLQSEVSRLTAFSAALQASAAEATAAAKHAASEAAAKGQSADKPADRQHASQSGGGARRAGLTPLKPAGSRLAGTLKSAESVGMPGTPTDAPAGAGGSSGRQGRGAAGRGFSSDGGGSMVGTPHATQSGGPTRLAQSSRFSGGGGNNSGGARQSDEAEAAGDDAGQQGSRQAAGAAGVSYAPQHWEEVKLLQGKVEALR